MAYRIKPFSILTFLNTACFADGMKLSPGANPYDGMLDCCIISSTSFSNSVILGLLAYRALHLKSKKTSIIRSNSFKVTSDQQMDFLVDGQIVKGVGEFEVSVIHKALGIFGI